MSINFMNIPTDNVRSNETNEDCFCRIMETFMGEFPIESADFSYELLGSWVMKNHKRMPSKAFPVAWLEDEDGNITEYFVFLKDKTLKHIEVK